MKSWIKKLLIIAIAVVVLGAIAVWYIFNEKFTDTLKVDASYNVDAQSLLKEFTENDTLANKKYVEKIITVNGIISEVETMDSTINLKITDTITNAYIIFAFQNEQIEKIKLLKEGDKVSIKGSCSGGAYIDIAEAESVNFKRCVLNK